MAHLAVAGNRGPEGKDFSAETGGARLKTEIVGYSDYHRNRNEGIETFATLCELHKAAQLKAGPASLWARIDQLDGTNHKAYGQKPDFRGRGWNHLSRVMVELPCGTCQEVFVDVEKGPMAYLSNGKIGPLHLTPSACGEQRMYRATHNTRTWDQMTSTEKQVHLLLAAKKNRAQCELRGDDFWAEVKEKFGLNEEGLAPGRQEREAEAQERLQNVGAEHEEDSRGEAE
eukprot:gnl/TRDRNA2_/TRDRNA2_196249_c0_seq1.p1 gnl/TRDRNA2_/TRDRNA2_196249_c0~~gnl/TRDRNA2_/TRDRNA2_196249_c0_seq1.p1  ORF type:complete len:229 (+),score=43.10 gnl/TRDRNA2_/TRDRNA2_196249_c0_seq1:65-751(+)